MALATGTFPRPRVNRTGPSSSSGVQLGPLSEPQNPPITRTFPFAIQNNAAGVRSSASTPLIRGPALVIGFYASKNGAATGTFGFGLGKSTSPVFENSVAIATTIPFQSLYEPIPQVGIPPTSPNGTDVVLDVQPSLMLQESTPNIIILDAEFYLVVFCANNGAGVSLVGHVTVLEQVSRDALLSFL